MRISKFYKPEACVSKDAERMHLCHPYLDVKRERLVATDGRRMIALPVEVEKGEVSGHIASDLLKVGRKKTGKHEVEYEIRERVRLVPHDIEWPLQAVPDFPDWSAVLPRYRPGDPGTVTVGLDAALLKGIADALGSDGQVALTFRLDSLNLDMSPQDAAKQGLEPQILVRSTLAREGELAVLMPVRLDRALRRVEPPAREDEGEEDAAAAERAAAKEAADILLRADGSGHLVDPKRPSRAVAAAVQRFKDAVPEGTSVSVQSPGGRETVLVDKTKGKPGA